MIRILFLALLLASPVSAATVKNFGTGSRGPSSVSLFDKDGPDDLVGSILHWNAVNRGRGFVRSMTFTMAGFGDIDIELDTTTNHASGSPDSIRVLALPTMLRASAMMRNSEENSFGTIDLFYAAPKAISPSGEMATPVPLPAGLGLGVIGLASIMSLRFRRRA